MRTPLLPTSKTEWEPDSNQNRKRCALGAGLEIGPVGRLWRELSRQLEDGLPGDSGRNVVNLCSFRGPNGKKLNLYGRWPWKNVLPLNNIAGSSLPKKWGREEGDKGRSELITVFCKPPLSGRGLPTELLCLFFPFLSTLDRAPWSGDREARRARVGWGSA